MIANDVSLWSGLRGRPGLLLVVATPILQSATGTLAVLTLDAPADWSATATYLDPQTGITWTATRTGAQTADLTADSLGAYAALPLGETETATLRFALATGGIVRVRVTIEGVDAIPLAASLTQGNWDAVELAEVTTVAGAVTFELLSGSTPAGLTLHAPSGQIYGIPSAAGSSSAFYRVSNPGGDAEVVEVSYTIAATPSTFASVSGGTLTSTGGGDANPNNMTTDSGFLSVIIDLQTVTIEPGVTVTLHEAGGRSQILVLATGGLRVRLLNAANTQIILRDIAGFTAAFSTGIRRLHIVADVSSTDHTNSTLQVFYDGVEQTWTALGTWNAAAFGPIDHTRNAGYSLGRGINLGTTQIPSDWVFRAFYVNFSAAILPAAATADDLSAVGTPEILFQGPLATWTTPTSTGTPRVSATWTAPAAWSLVTAGETVDTTPRAFADAVGHGRATVGGRGQTLIEVTTASEAAIRAAKAAAALEPSGAYVRVVVEGEIFLAAALDLDVPDTTWDFRFAPGLGCWFTGSRVRAAANNCLVIGALSAPGSRRRGQVYESRDAIAIGLTSTALTDIYLDRCAALWSTDECFSTWPDGTGGSITRCTVDGLLAAEALAFPREDPGGSTDYRIGHPKQWLVGFNTRQTTFTRSASLSGYERNFLATPFGATSETDYEFVGNVVGNWGLQATQISRNDSGAAHLARVENVIFLAGDTSGSATMTSRQSTRPVIFLHADYADGDVYFNDVAVWSVASDFSITSTPLDDTPPAVPMGQGLATTLDALEQVRRTDPDADNRYWPGANWNVATAAAPASDAPRLALPAVYAAVRDRVGPKLRNGARHPFLERIHRYGLPAPVSDTKLEARPFSTALGYRGANYKGALDEFIHLGVTVAPGEGTITVTVLEASLPAATDYPWLDITVQAQPVSNKADQTGWSATSDAAINELRPAGHAALPADMFCSTVTPSDDQDPKVDFSSPVLLGVLGATGGVTDYSGDPLAAGTWVVRVGWRTATTTVWVESGLLWRVT